MKKLLAVDGNSILNRAYYGIRPLANSSGLYTHAVYGFINILSRQIEALKPDALAVAFDLKGPTFRHELYDGYKATRKGMPEELAVQLPYAKTGVSALGGDVLTLEGYEADDILGTLSGLSAQSAGEWETYILTGDRDSLQLIGEATTIMLATNSDTVPFDRDKFIETYGVAPEQFVDMKALMGDSSDNIPGVPGIGEKTAAKLIAEFGSLDGVYENLAASSIAKGVRAKLEAGRDSAYMSRELAKIDCAAPLGVSLDGISDGRPRREELYELFVELEFAGLIKRFGLEPGQSEVVTPVEKKLVKVGAGELSEKLSGSAALLFEDGGVSAACDTETIYVCEKADIPALAAELRKKGIRTIVYDSKKLYGEYSTDALDFDFDVMLAAYVVDPTDGNYTPERLKIKYLGMSGEELDAVILYKLYSELDRIITERSQQSLLHDIEMPLAKVLADMERRGFKVDTDGLIRFADRLAQRADFLRDLICDDAGEEFNVNSPKQLGEVLFDRLGLPSGKKTKSGYSTSAEVLERLMPYHPIIGNILDYRQLTKLKSTYGDGLVKAADSEGRIHSSFNQTITATGRLSSTEPNLQNIPVRTELGREMRRFFIPDSPDRVLVDADYSQIELRLLAHISGDETMLEAFRTGIDIHTVTASQAFGVPLELVTSDMRKRAKAVNFGIVYGISDFSLAQDIGVTKKQAGEYIAAYLAKYPKVDEYLKNVVEQAREDGYVTTLFGRRRDIPELASSKKTLQAFGERVAMNSPLQGTAADIIKIAMINVERALRESGLDAKLILQVHDELIVESSREDSEAVRELLVREMESAVELSLPLTVSAQIGASWFDCKD